VFKKENVLAGPAMVNKNSVLTRKSHERRQGKWAKASNCSCLCLDDWTLMSKSRFLPQHYLKELLWKVVTASQCLSITSRYLATGNIFQDVKFSSCLLLGKTVT